MSDLADGVTLIDEKPHPDMASPRFPQIERVEASGVLGDYDYSFDFRETNRDPHSDRVRVIYARNGSGKTNLLRAVYHLLTPDIDSLQALIDIPISKLRVLFRSGATITLSRAGSLDGPYSVEISQPQGESDKDLPNKLVVEPSDFGSRVYRRVLLARADYDSYLVGLHRLQGHTIFVGDDRSVQSAVPIFKQQESFVKSFREYDRIAPRSAVIASARTQEVQESLKRIEEIFSRMAFADISMESGQGGGAYAEITRHVLNGKKQELLAAEARSSLLAKISQILLRGISFERYGLINLKQVKRIRTEIVETRSNNTKLKSLHGVLDPYLSNLLEQMDALEKTKDVIDAFVTSVNGFLERKSLSFQTLSGITLLNRNHEMLDPEKLSSGEKHLLLLLSNAVIASRVGCLFIIDEPELSLGIEWQRKLISELLRCTAGSSVQFLIASHSVQIMTDISEVVSPREVN
ncbi:ATP-binding protein [Paenarthrobacter aurescens]|uniref:ATP-binding protein n=1 Tax=Paenarthrobacter aurescens TaxID=43663 RepID=UPI0021BFEA5A|nr:ATP-binding protein [Paenarthrobacter aurescens]MCT9872004.1 ATP-binding protein [Paenarthrobacter aurescens]